MATDNLPYIRLGQVWMFPIVRSFSWSGVNVVEGAFGFYQVKEKNSNGMWKLKRVMITPEEEGLNEGKTFTDQFHNRFIKRNTIVHYGTLIGEKVDLNTLKVLYGTK